MNIITSSEKRRCTRCQSKKTNEYLTFVRCGIEIRIPLCEKCQKYATYNIYGGLKNAADIIHHILTLSFICGYDERKISEYQRKEREKR